MVRNAVGWMLVTFKGIAFIAAFIPTFRARERVGRVELPFAACEIVEDRKSVFADLASDNDIPLSG